MRSRRRGWRLPWAQLQDPGWLPLGSPSLARSVPAAAFFSSRRGRAGPAEPSARRRETLPSPELRWPLWRSIHGGPELQAGAGPPPRGLPHEPRDRERREEGT